MFDRDLLEKLTETLQTEPVTGAHVVVLRGAGKCWSVGLSVEDHLRPRVGAMLASFRATLSTLWNLPVPTIAQVHGSCLGGGMELLMACDLAIASDRATFGQPEIRLGVFAPFGAANYTRLLGRPRGRGAPLPRDAVRCPAGCRSRDHQPRGPRRGARGLRRPHRPDVLSHRKDTLRLLKQVLRRERTGPWASLGMAERAYLDELMSPDDAEEGLRAFLEKRTPVWNDA